MEIRPYFHIYADGHWALPVHQYFQALKESKLSDAAIVNIGLIGSKENREHVLNYIDSKFQVQYKVVVEKPTGWEQETLRILHADSKTLPPFRAFYAHTKGSAFPTPINNSWREDMIFHNIGKWRKASSLLDQYDIVGIYWMEYLKFFAGNYFWTNSTFLADLPECGMENRHLAESWVRSGQATPKIYDLFPGFPSVHPRMVSLLPPNMNKENIETMIVTFRCDGRVLEYKPGRFYEVELTPQLEVLLRDGSNLILIDPPTVDRLTSVKAKKAEVLTTLPNQTINNNGNLSKTPTPASVLSTPNPVNKATKPELKETVPNASPTLQNTGKSEGNSSN